MFEGRGEEENYPAILITQYLHLNVIILPLFSRSQPFSSSMSSPETTRRKPHPTILPYLLITMPSLHKNEECTVR
jgi:hypothetical protein